MRDQPATRAFGPGIRADGPFRSLVFAVVEDIRPGTTTRPGELQNRRLHLAAVLLSSWVTAATTLVAVWWDPIDARIVTAADDAGWVPGLLVPHQQLLWLAVNGAVVLSVVLTLVTVVILLRSRRR